MIDDASMQVSPMVEVSNMRNNVMKKGKPQESSSSADILSWMEDGKKTHSEMDENVPEPVELLSSLHQKQDFLEVVQTLSSEVSNCSGEHFQKICDDSMKIDQPGSPLHPEKCVHPVMP